MHGVPVAVMANKQDLPKAVVPHELASKLGLSRLTDRQWRVQGTCATSGEGIHESVIEFSRMVKEYQH